MVWFYGATSCKAEGIKKILSLIVILFIIFIHGISFFSFAENNAISNPENTKINNAQSQITTKERQNQNVEIERNKKDGIDFVALSFGVTLALIIIIILQRIIKVQAVRESNENIASIEAVLSFEPDKEFKRIANS